MPTLNEKMELGVALFSQPKELGERRVYGTATAASSGGSVSVNVGGEVITVPTIGAVASGQEVVIEVQNGHPVCIGVAGWGDDIQSDVDDVISHVWIDSNGDLRVTREPEDQNPTDGVTVSASAVEVASATHAAIVDAHGLIVEDAYSNDLIGLRDSFSGMNSAPAVIAHGGIQVVGAQSSDLDNVISDYSSIVLEDRPNNADYGSLRYVIGAVTYENAPQVVFGTETTGEDANGYVAANVLILDGSKVYATATASRLGAVKIGSGLAIAADGTLSEYDSGWTNVISGGAIKARVVGKMMTVKAIGYTTSTTSGWVTVGTLPASVTQTCRFLVCKYSNGTVRRGEIDGANLKIHQSGSADGIEFTVTVPIG